MPRDPSRLRVFDPECIGARPRRQTESPTVNTVISLYLAHARKTLSTVGYYDYSTILNRLAKSIGDKPLDECLPIHLADWIAEQTGWRSDSTIRGNLNRIQACFRWYARMTKTVNPFEGLRHQRRKLLSHVGLL